ncbi:unnamed protein product [Phytophthora fragariaefolia]|uniref:Unnamed protein product n=1 Tax=Phytophthora fragariaefolia TaxID=1490495 RepID=A0A9W6XYQ4_9STRA|nr:unnamed protein product [Phytophthora fragariaefolia]
MAPTGKGRHASGCRDNDQVGAVDETAFKYTLSLLHSTAPKTTKYTLVASSSQSVVKAREQYEENIHQRCEWTGEDYKAVVRSVRSAVDPDMMTFLATYEIGKDKSHITDEDIMVKVKERCETTNRDYLANPTTLFTQNLKMDLMVKDVPDRVAKYFRQFEKIIADNGFHEHMDRGDKVPSTQENTRSDSGQRSSNEGGKAAAGPGNIGQGQNQSRKWGSGRPPPRTGCLHCKQDHWLRDCQVATPEDKKAALATQQSKIWKVKRAAIGKHDDIGEFAEKGAIPTEGADDEEYSVPVEGVGGKITLCHEAAQIDVQIRTSTGPVNLYKLDCLVVDGETQFLLIKKVVKLLEIDVKRVFEQLVNTSIELNHDDFPDEPEVGEVVDADIERELDRMCKEINEVLSDDQYKDFRAVVIKLSKDFTRRLYRTRVGHDEPALVESLVVTLKKGEEPIRCKPHRYPPAQLKYLEEHVAQLLKFGFVRKNNLSKWASNAVPVLKPGSNNEIRGTNNYIKINNKTVSIAGTMPHSSIIRRHVPGVKFIAKFDMFKGFWLIMLAEECQEMFSFMTHDGVYTPLRVSQGAADSVLHFQDQM